MKFSKAGGKRSFEAPRLRQPGPIAGLEVHSGETVRGVTSTLERVLPKKGTKDCDTCTHLRTAPDHKIENPLHEKKSDRLKIPKCFSILFSVICIASVVMLGYFKTSNFITVAENHYSLRSNSNRFPQYVQSGCLRAGLSGSNLLEPKYSRFENLGTSCDLPKGASLLGILQLKRRGEGLKIGLVNIDEDEQQNWHHFVHGWAKYIVYPFEPVDRNLLWSDLYPEWIDEGAPQNCPRLPMPTVAGHLAQQLHAVIVKVPCGRRDVTRLQILLAAATVATKASGDFAETMLVLVISKCRPIVNILSCDELVEHEDDLWLFEVNLQRMRERLALPLGSCELALHIDQNHVAQEAITTSGARQDIGLLRLGSTLTSQPSTRSKREAYATLLHTDATYVCGAIVAAQSIRATGSKKDLVALVDENISANARTALQLAGWILHDIDRIRNPKSDADKYNAWNYSKFRLWQLTEYEKVIFLDGDLLVLRSLDFLFDMPQLSATGNDKTLFNSGVMVIEPSNCTFAMLMEQIDEIDSYNGGDQGYLNEIFPWWHRIPKSFNFLKFFWSNETREIEEMNRLFQATDPPQLHVIHFLGRKPWLCYRDYDCNWNAAKYRQYASDEAHARWWAVHDAMPAELQQQCLLRTVNKAHFEFNRREAQKANFPDEHWKLTITDPRFSICTEKFCNWHSMLAIWGKPLPPPAATAIK